MLNNSERQQIRYVEIEEIYIFRHHNNDNIDLFKKWFCVWKKNITINHKIILNHNHTDMVTVLHKNTENRNDTNPS